MCSTRNAPMGTTPLREWSLRRKNEWPWPARRGGTPRVRAGAAGLAVVAMVWWLLLGLSGMVTGEQDRGLGPTLYYWRRKEAASRKRGFSCCVIACRDEDLHVDQHAWFGD